MTLFVFPGTTISSFPIPAGAATEAKQDTGNASLATIAAKDFATSAKQDTLIAKDFATSAKQDTGNGSLATIAAKDFATQTTLAAVLAKIGGSLVPSSFDSIAADYSGLTTNVFTYKQGLTTVAIITVTYQDSTKAKFTTVVRT